MEQYQTLRSRDVEVALTVGPWTHLTVDNKVSMPQAISWLDTHVAGRAAATREAPVQVFVGGVGAWQKHESWPPGDTTSTTWYLRTGQLTPAAPEDNAGTTRFPYDPADPTPSVGGRLMAPSGGAKDNRKLETRADVLTFTTAPLTEPVEMHGRPVMELHVASDNADADLFARVCDVDPAGRSINVTDRITRCTERDTTSGEVRRVEITLDPTAHRFNAGHRIRLQISGGAFPRFARNPAPARLASVRNDVHTGAHCTTSASCARSFHCVVPWAISSRIGSNDCAKNVARLRVPSAPAWPIGVVGAAGWLDAWLLVHR